MLEIRKGTAAKNYENTFFREFAANLKKMFDKYSLDGLLIANAECEVENRLQIDALLITPRAVCIIDFKNFGGQITLPKSSKSGFDFGVWRNENAEVIKGGSSVNPFIQLRKQKERFTKVIGRQITNKLPQGNVFNAFHTVRAVCFQKPVEIIGKIPASEELNFFILDQQSYLEKIMDIIDISDKEVLLTNESFDLFKEVFRADPFDTEEKYELGHDFTSYQSDLDFDSLYPDQKSALAEIENFILSESDRVFILQGTSLSGKTHLIPFIQEIAFNRQISEVKLFASSSRVANNLLKNTKFEFAGMYSYIYGGTPSLLHEEDPEREDTLNLEIVPLRKSDNMDEAIFIVDESHLVSDNYHQSVDLRFGSGKLLKDFLEFSELETSKRKLIFVGDSFQLSLGKKEESALNPEYFKDEYGLKTMAFHLIDKGERSMVVTQALKAVDGIRLQCFNNLDFSLNKNIRTLSKEEFKPQIADSLRADAHILCFSNSDAQKVNFWIKNSILKNGNEPIAGDLLIFGNNIRVEDPDQPFAEPKKVYNGQFGNIVEVSGLIEKHERLLVPLHFRRMQIRLKGAGHVLSFLSFENFRLSDKGELSKEEVISLQILLNQLAEKEIGNFVTGKYQVDEDLKKLLIKYEPENRKGISKLLNALQVRLRNIPSSEYYQIKNAAQLRFGWALTVHKSMSYKWEEIFFNVETGGGKTNENYFKWIYTGLIRARSKVSLINYEPINPFCKFMIHPSVPKIDQGKQFFFISDKTVEASDKNIAEKYSFPETEHRSVLLQLFQFMDNKISKNGLTIQSVSHISYQVLYELTGSPGEYATVSIYYNNRGQFKMPALMKSAPKEFGEELIVLLKAENKIADFSFVKSEWRKLAYEQLNLVLREKTISFGYIIQVPYKDIIQLHKSNEILVMDLYYDGDGFFTSLIATSTTSMEFWDEIKGFLTGMKGKTC